MELSRATFRSKEENKVPSGCEIVKKETRLEVEEIENGFLVVKSADIKYLDENGNTQWCYPCKKYFSNTNPLKIEEKSLADKFD